MSLSPWDTTTSRPARAHESILSDGPSVHSPSILDPPNRLSPGVTCRYRHLRDVSGLGIQTRWLENLALPPLFLDELVDPTSYKSLVVGTILLSLPSPSPKTERNLHHLALDALFEHRLNLRGLPV